MAAPTRAFSCCIKRSAAAMSGRRSSSVDGTLTGILGSLLPSGEGLIVNSAGGRPIKAAIACSNCARMMPTLIACASVLRSCDIALRDRAGLILILGYLQRPLEDRDRAIEQRLQRIRRAKIIISGGEQGLG